MGTLIALPAGNYDWYDTNVSGVPVAGPTSVTVAALTPGTISPASPTVGQTLSVTGSNAPPGAAFLWELSTNGGTSYGPAGGTNNAATYSTTGQPVGLYRRRTTLVNGAVATTAAVTLAAGGVTFTEIASGSSNTDLANGATQDFTVNLSAVPAGGTLYLATCIGMTTTGTASWTLDGVSMPLFTVGADESRSPDGGGRFFHTQLVRVARSAVGSGASTILRLTAGQGHFGVAWKLIKVDGAGADTDITHASGAQPLDLSLTTVAGGAGIVVAVAELTTPSFTAGATLLGSTVTNLSPDQIRLAVGTFTGAGAGTRTVTSDAGSSGSRFGMSFSFGAA